LRKRSAARAIALQALYQFDLRGEEFAGHLREFLAEWSQDKEVRAHALSLVEGCRLVLPDLDAAISSRARNWVLSRMPAIDRCILRLGAYELLYASDVPPKSAIDEAVRLAKKYSTEDSSAFVNGVLDKVMSDLCDRVQEKA